MPAASRVWLVDFGLAAKVRQALLLTGEAADDELDHLQQVQTVSAMKLLRRLGALTDAEMGLVRAALAKRFAI